MNHANLPNVAGATLPATYESARKALSECSRLDECQQWADKAKALASYAKQAQDESLKKMADRIKTRAILRAGELLKQIEPAQGANQNIKDGTDQKVFTRTQAATEAGLSERQRKTALQVANVPRDEFERQVESDNPPTITELAEQGKKKKNIVDLQGRDPTEFNRAIHFVALFERHLKSLKSEDYLSAVEILNEAERSKIRNAINGIDAIHDEVITRI